MTEQPAAATHESQIELDVEADARRNFIVKRWTDAVDAIIDCGGELIEARQELSKVQFEALVATLPFGRRTAERLMAVARNQWLATHESQLPASWTTLYELSRLSPAALDDALRSGLIRPDMDRREAIALRRPARPAPAEAPPLAEAGAGRRYGAILADPPWPFETWSDAGRDRSPERHYPTMSIEAIKALPVGELAAEDCCLFLWAVSATAREAVETIAAWGFAYKSIAFVWVKEGAFGNGYWTRQRAEACLLATRGSPQRLAADVDQVIAAPRGRHSEKPEEAAARIERLVGGPYLELFARRRRPGWDVWGNEVGDG